MVSCGNICLYPTKVFQESRPRLAASRKGEEQDGEGKGKIIAPAVAYQLPYTDIIL
jgi:hypothetical protein